MSKINITTNAKVVVANLKIKKNKMINNIKNEINEVSLYMEGRIKESISGRLAEQRSVDTGKFMGGIKGTSKDLTATIASNVTYSKDLEFGSSRLKPRRHFRNSLSREKQKVTDFIKKALKT